MDELKPITREAVPAALLKAERYRLIGDPWSAESICLDVLEVEPDNQTALVTLLLALTDEMTETPAESESRAREVLPRLADPYKRAYYAGIVCERRAKAQLKRDPPGAGAVAYALLREAMGWYERAEAIRPPKNDETLLRWNACVRLLRRREQLKPRGDEESEPGLE
ncbi:MAG TPA: hypothetical protein VEI06_11945 [Gemmatimonadaceae bacterium]|nr:hypothetical protein [Gemmatimonadaceae bacterium]